MAPHVAIVTAVWNQLDMTLKCLASASELDYPNVSLTVVDNGSDEDVLGPIGEAYPTATLIRLDKNLGFAAGFNHGIKAALENNPDYLLVINNDVFFAPDTLAKLVDRAEKAERPGQISPKIYYLEAPKRIWHAGGKVSSALLEVTHAAVDVDDAGQFDKWDELDFIPLCVALIPAKAFEEVGLFDEGFFLFYEDMDFSLRLKQAGYSLHLVPDAHVWHAVSTSSGGFYAPLERYWMAQASGRFFRKHGRPLQLLFLILPYRMASALKMTFKLLSQGKSRSLRAYWLGLWRGWSTGKAVTQPPDWVL